MGPETKNRAPGAEKFRVTNLWWPLTVMVLAVSAVVYTEDQDTSNQEQSTKTGQSLSPEIGSLKPDLLVRSIPIRKLAQEPLEIDVRRLISRSIPTPTRQAEENYRVQALSAETQPNVNEIEVIGWLISGGWPQELHSQALTVVGCESTNNPNAVSPNGLYKGLFQLEKRWFDLFGEDFNEWADPVVNARVAYKTYLYDLEVGNPPWTKWPGCRNLLFD